MRAGLPNSSFPHFTTPMTHFLFVPPPAVLGVHPEGLHMAR